MEKGQVQDCWHPADGRCTFNLGGYTMSMTSRVNPTLASAILNILAGGLVGGLQSSNGFLLYRLNITRPYYTSEYSLRIVQEATQKMTKEGVLASKRDNGTTYYFVPKAAVTGGISLAATTA